MAQDFPRKIFRRSKPPQSINARATVFNIKRADDSTSRQVAFSDLFLQLADINGATVVLPTPYNVPRLFELIQQSNMVQQCIDAYATNTVLAGWEAVPMYRGRTADPGETIELESFIEHANTDESLSMVMDKVIRDREAVGFGFMEIIRDRSRDISLFRHAPALWTRLCAKHPQEQLVNYSIARGRRVTTVKEYRKFRRYLQLVNGIHVWFKEFGDPRRMDWTNGAFEGVDDGFDPANLATEIYHFKRPSNEAYGVPQWINQLPSIIGSREAEEVNMRYFKDNTVPPMLLLVGNGRLTAQSYRELTRALNDEDIGAQRQNKIMLLEAVGEGDSMDGKNSAIELKVEKLSDARQSDGLFKAYDEANMAKVRSSFRLPPITVGMSQDVNFATASTSAFVAESQVFSPARNQIDEVLNNQIIHGPHGLGLKSVKLLSRTPSITSPEMVIKTMTALNVMGALTPRTAQQGANKLLQMEIPEYPKKGEEDYEDWMDRPVSMADRGPLGSGYDTGNGNGTDGDGNPAAPPITKDANGNAIIPPDHPLHPDNLNAGDTPPAAGKAPAKGLTPKGKVPATQKAQKLKDPSVKATEKTGDVSKSRPKNGQQ